MSQYIVVTSQNSKSYYLAKERIGGGYTTIATFTHESAAKDTAALLNNRFEPPRLVKLGAKR